MTTIDYDELFQEVAWTASSRLRHPPHRRGHASKPLYLLVATLEKSIDFSGFAVNKDSLVAHLVSRMHHQLLTIQN